MYIKNISHEVVIFAPKAMNIKTSYATFPKIEMLEYTVYIYIFTNSKPIYEKDEFFSSFKGHYLSKQRIQSCQQGEVPFALGKLEYISAADL